MQQLYQRTAASGAATIRPGSHTVVMIADIVVQGSVIIFGITPTRRHSANVNLIMIAIGSTLPTVSVPSVTATKRFHRDVCYRGPISDVL